jgi:hypothetical protein
MAIFGDLGKALGLGSGEDLLPLIGTAAGFYFGGPMGASIGSGLGSLAGGKSVNDALTNAALAYGVTSFLPANMSQSGNQSFLNQKIYGDTAAKTLAETGIQQASVNVPTTSTFGDSLTTAQVEAAGKATADSGSMFDTIIDFTKENPMTALGIGSAALGALSSPEEEVSSTRPYAGGEAHKVAYLGVEYDLRDPDQIQAYKEAKRETQRPDFKYDVESVYAKHGGAMYEHGIEHPAERGDYTGEVAGAGTGTSDSVPAWLSDGEFVLTAKAVKGAGGGDRDIGAARMYDMMAELEATA